MTPPIDVNVNRSTQTHTARLVQHWDVVDGNVAEFTSERARSSHRTVKHDKACNHQGSVFHSNIRTFTEKLFHKQRQRPHRRRWRRCKKHVHDQCNAGADAEADAGIGPGYHPGIGMAVGAPTLLAGLDVDLCPDPSLVLLICVQRLWNRHANLSLSKSVIDRTQRNCVEFVCPPQDIMCQKTTQLACMFVHSFRKQFRIGMGTFAWKYKVCFYRFCVNSK